MNHTNLWRIVLTVATMAILFCTGKDNIVGTVDESDTGVSIAVFLPDSTPAVDALIKFIPSTRSQPALLKKTKASKANITVVRTDSKGRFKVPQLPDSTYNVFMEKDSLKAFQGSVAITSKGHSLHDDTLRQTGSFTAVVGLDPRDMHNVNAVVVQILGSDIDYINPDKHGVFKFENIAAGKYTLKLECNLPEYSPTPFTMTIKSGIDSILPDTIFMNYTGIPSVKGLTASYDTSKGVVRLSWNKTEYANILDYVVFRDDDTSVTYSQTPYRASKDTVFTDTIFRVSPQGNGVDTISRGYRYRVAIRNNSTVTGSTFGSVAVKAIPYKSILPVPDSLRVVFDTLQGIATVRWKDVGAEDSTLKYQLIRHLAGYVASSGAGLQKIDTTDTIGITSLPVFYDTLLGTILEFTDTLVYQVSYAVEVVKTDWKLSGLPIVKSDLLILPYNTLIKRIKSPVINYDTLHGITTLSWTGMQDGSLVSGYRVIRSVYNSLIDTVKVDTISLLPATTLFDTIYPDIIPFENLSLTQIAYQIAPYHSKWKIYGENTGATISVHSYKAYAPQISAGQNQTVDISSEVLLQGSVLGTTYPVVKMEWKVGAGDWVVADSGKHVFTTNGEYETENISCVFKVTDSVGNVALDTVMVTKRMLVTTFSKLPSNGGVPRMGSATVTSYNINVVEFKNGDSIDYAHFGYLDNNKYAIWKTKNLIEWNLITPSIGTDRSGDLLCFNSNYFVYPMDQYDYSDGQHFKIVYISDDCSTWLQQQVSYADERIYLKSRFLTLFNKIYVIVSNDNQWSPSYTVAKSDDGINWINTGNKLPSEFTYYRTPTVFDKIGSSLFCSHGNKKYITLNEGETWSEDKLWDADSDLFPDDILMISSSDSITVVYYNERPSNVKKMIMWRENQWINLPIDKMNINIPYLRHIQIFGNRLLYLESYDSWISSTTNYQVKSFKLF